MASLARRTEVGDGDTCPLFPAHGNMVVLPASDPPTQFCPHQTHDGKPGKEMPPSRNHWPLYGFEESVQSYLARLDRAIQSASLPDLSDVEV